MRRAKGFTILELLLTMSIMVMVMTMIHSALAVSSKICTGGRDRAGLYQGARLAMDEILGALSNLEYASTGQYEFVSTTMDADGFPCDSIDFVTLISPLEVDGRWLAGEARVKYEVIVNEEGVSVLQKQLCAIDDEGRTSVSTIEMVEGVVGMQIEFYDEDGNCERGWNTSIEDEEQPFEAVITLFIDLGKQVQPLMSAVMLPTMKEKTGDVGDGSSSRNNDSAESEEEPLDGGGRSGRGGTSPGSGRGSSGGGRSSSGGTPPPPPPSGGPE